MSPSIEVSTERGWLEDTSSFFGEILGTVTDTAGLFYNRWLDDEFGGGGEPQNAVQTPQGKNADVSNAPNVAFGFSQTQLLIGAVALVGVVLLVRK